MQGRIQQRQRQHPINITRVTKKTNPPAEDPAIIARDDGELVSASGNMQESPSAETVPSQTTQVEENKSKYEVAGQGLQLTLDNLMPLQSTHVLLAVGKK